MEHAHVRPILIEDLMKPEHSTLSELAADLRERAGLSQGKIADATYVSRWTVSRYESGAVRPPVGYVAFLAEEVLRQDEVRDDVQPDVAEKLLETLNTAIALYYGRRHRLASWPSLCEASERWVAQNRAKKGRGRHDALADPQPADEAVIPAQPATSPLALWQLRAPTPDFVGRAAELAQLACALRTEGSCRRIGLACIRGLGGAGKTELAYRAAQELAADYPDGQLLLGLSGSGPAPLRAEGALAQVLRSFAPQEQLPEELTELRARYRTVLRDRRVLIVADDARDATQLRELLPPAGCGLLITARRRFALDGLVDAGIVELGGLAPDEAARLLRREWAMPRLSCRPSAATCRWPCASPAAAWRATARCRLRTMWPSCATSAAGWPPSMMTRLGTACGQRCALAMPPWNRWRRRCLPSSACSRRASLARQ
jgi:transcriptional regulator with XRE-family HTH domain